MTKTKYEIIEVNNVDITVDISMLTSSESLFFNATEMARTFNKRPSDFWKQSQNEEYLESIVTLYGGIKDDYVKTKKGGKNQGTWLHNKLALQFARWLSSNFSVKLDKWIIEKLKEEENRRRERLESKTGYLEMSEAVQESHDDPKFYHFSNEADLINRIVLGMTSKQYKEKHGVDNVRDNLCFEDIRRIDELSKINTSLIKIGVDFQERKNKLLSYFNSSLLT